LKIKLLVEKSYILLKELCRLLPIQNIQNQNKQLAELGVARISYGPRPYYLAMNALKEAERP
jgi:2-methylisocitrate lyase-like PEP mutase family enzyme